MRARMLALLLLLRLAPATAGAAEPWSAPDRVSGAANDLLAYDLGIDARGRALATWEVLRWQDAAGGGRFVFAGRRGATRAPGAAAFGATFTVPAFRAGPVLYGVTRAVGLDQRSLGWSRCGELATVRARFGTSSGGFGAPRTIATARGPGGDPDPAVAADGAGIVLAGWAASGGGTCATSSIRVALRRPGAAAFGAPQVLRGSGRNETPSVAVGQGGDLLAAWARRIGEGRTVIEARVRRAGAPWGPVERLGTSTVAGPIRTALLQNGRAIVAWGAQSINESTGLRASFQVAVRAAGARAFSATQTLEQVATAVQYPPRLGPVLAVAGREALIAWTGRDGGAWRVRVARSGASGRFGAAQTVSPAGAVLGDLAALPDGTALVAWARLDDEGLPVAGVGAAARRAGAGAFGPAVTVNPGALRLPGAALDPVSRRPTVAWAERLGPVTSVRTITAYVLAATRSAP
ncbi:MAG: hypothetical protein MUC84_10510 [Solirubrobacteraceae bacterium]|nr:hypothetical protein [Solirubrobacteraceae bacterium]